MTMLGLTGCATTEEAAAPAVAAAPAGKSKSQNDTVATGSRIAGTRSNMVSATSGADAQQQMRDRPAPYRHKN
jgi:hypothetical protein